VLDAKERWKVVPHGSHDFSPLFVVEGSRGLPPKCPGLSHETNLTPDLLPPFESLSGLSQAELKDQKEWLDDTLETGFIQPTASPATSPIGFIKRKEDSLTLCFDYRKLNQETIKG
jgi:hypothetical protein